MQVSEIMGKGVLDKNANTVGKVTDIEVNFPIWTINHLIVKVSLFKKLKIGVEKVDKVGDKVTLKVARDELG
jgi:sporulation protein YlmC with PRC-barrel domain